MKAFTMKLAYFPLLLLVCSWSNQCIGHLVSLTDEDRFIIRGHSNSCDGPINIPYKIFNHNTLYVCTQGVVSFGSPITHTNRKIPRRRGPPFIAVHWHHFNTGGTNTGQVFYRSTSSDVSLLTSTSHTVQRGLSREGFANFQSSWVFVVTWHNVSAVPSETSSTFQLVLTSDALRHVMIFHYGRIHHRGTGGYDSRDGHNYMRLPSDELLNGTNVGLPGRWVFQANTVPVRLVGRNPREGRLEVFYNGTWGTVCNHYITDIAAKVVCSQLRFGYFGYVVRKVYTPGTGPIWLDKVQCRGHESDLGQCSHLPWGQNDCNHQQDVSVACYVRNIAAAATVPESRGRNVLRWF